MRHFKTLLACALLAGAVGCKGSSSSRQCKPTGLTATSKTTTTIALSWSAPAASCDVTGYSVREGEAEVATSTSTSVDVTGLDPNTLHTFTVAALSGDKASPSAPLEVATLPDLGPNTHIFDPTMNMADIQAAIDAVYEPQFSDVSGQFDTNRAALLFKPGAYGVNVWIGYYMQVLGLGALPTDTSITGMVTSYGHNNGGAAGYNATQNFWRGVENFTVIPVANTGTVPITGAADDNGVYMRWAVSQACPFRRMNVEGDIQLHHWGGWSSGGWMSDSNIDGVANSGSQQQWFTRNSTIGSWSSVNWNMVYMGVDHPFVDLFEKGWADVRTTVFDTTPKIREKPFLHVDEHGDYFVFLPSLQANTTGTTWASGQTPGTDIPMTDFFVARPGDAVEDINAALAAGKHLFLTPGIYHLDATIEVTQPDTIVLGIGLATLHPDTGLPAMTVADVDGVTIAGVLFDAGSQNSPVLLRVGEDGASADHSADPTVLADVFMRIGGAEDGKADVGMIINSHDVIGDHFWIWRADHGTEASPTGWTLNPSTNGLVVNGDDVTVYGLFVEHFEGYQTLWNGERGRVYFYQSEIPYDVPSQDLWMNGDVNGYASYKVAETVTDHEAWGLGIYSVFNLFDGILDNAIEVPVADNVKMHHMVTFGLSLGIINHVINGEGGPATSGATPELGGWQQGVVVEYPVPPPVVLPDPADLVLPFNFESTPNARYGFPSWGGGLQFGIIHDPDDASNHVLGFKRQGGDAWAGFSIDGGDTSHWLAANPFDTSKVITLKMKCDTPNVPVLLKLETPTTPKQSIELAATSDASVDTWQTLTFDFSSEDIPDATLTQLDLFPGWAGGSNPGVNSLCYIDDLTLVVP